MWLNNKKDLIKFNAHQENGSPPAVNYSEFAGARTNSSYVKLQSFWWGSHLLLQEIYKSSHDTICKKFLVVTLKFISVLFIHSVLKVGNTTLSDWLLLCDCHKILLQCI